MKKTYAIREKFEIEHKLTLDIPNGTSEKEVENLLENIEWRIGKNGYDEIYREIPENVEYEFEQTPEYEAVTSDIQIKEVYNLGTRI